MSVIAFCSRQQHSRAGNEGSLIFHSIEEGPTRTLSCLKATRLYYFKLLKGGDSCPAVQQGVSVGAWLQIIMTLPVCLRCSDDGWGTDDGASHSFGQNWWKIVSSLHWDMASYMIGRKLWNIYSPIWQKVWRMQQIDGIPCNSSSHKQYNIIVS